MKRFLRIFSIVTIITLAFGVGFIAGNVSPNRFAANAQGIQPAGTEKLFGPFWEAWNLVHKMYIDGDKADDTKLMEGAAAGMMAALGDPHTAYMDPTFYQNTLTSDIQGQFDGIGASVKKDDKTGGLSIVSLMDNSPARGILKKGDIIITVDGNDVTALTEMEIVSKVRGPAGTSVKLGILREGKTKPIDLLVNRASIKIITVKTAMFPGNIGYIKLAEFNEHAEADFTAGLQKLNANKLNGLVFDLRDNPGGGLTTAINIASQFLPDGNILIYRGRPDSRQPEIKFPSTAAGKALAPNVPLIVLVNESSASASELVSGALQDRGRAQVIGVKSYGKGSVQQWGELSDGSGYRITIAHFFKPSGVVIDHVGIIPDTIVGWDKDANPDYDPQLNEAVMRLQHAF